MDAKHAPSDVSLVWTGIGQQANLAMVKFLTKYDVLLTPTLGRPPVKIGEIDQSLPIDKLIPLAQRRTSPSRRWPMRPANRRCRYRCFGTLTACRSAATSSAATRTRRRCYVWRPSSNKRGLGPSGVRQLSPSVNL